MFTARAKTVGLLILGAVIAAALGLVSIHVPFGRDQGVAAYAAELMSRGGVLYRDFYHFNFPGIFFAYRTAFLLPLGPVEAVNLLHLLSVLVTYFLVYGAARVELKPRAALVAAWFYAAFAIVIYTTYWNVAQKDSLAAPFLAGMLLVLLRHGRTRDLAPKAPLGTGGLLRLFGFGLLAGLAAQFKPTLGIVILAAVPAVIRERRHRGRLLAVAGLTIAGFAFAFIPLAVYLFTTGAAGPMFESVFRFGGFYGGQNYHGFFRTGLDALWQLVGWAYDWRFLTALGLIGAAAGIGSRAMRTTALCFLLLLIQVVAQMKFFTYHWIPLLVPLALLAARGSEAIFSAPRGQPDGPKRWALALILIALLFGNLGPETKRYRRELYYDLGRTPRDNFLAAYGKWGFGDLNPLASRLAAEYVARHTEPDEPILVFGLEPGFYISAQRFPPTRFAYDQPLVTEPGDNQPFGAYRQELREEFMRDISSQPPAYIVVIEDDATGIEAKDSYTQMREFPELSGLIDRDYALETKIEHYYLYRRLGREGR